MTCVIGIKFHQYEDWIHCANKISLAAIIKQICDIHGLEYKYYGFTLNNYIINPILPVYAFNHCLLDLCEIYK